VFINSTFAIFSQFYEHINCTLFENMSLNYEADLEISLSF